MKHRLFCGVMAIAFAVVLAAPAWAQLTPYSQDFEGLLDTTADQPDQVALANDGWKVFVNIFNPGGGYLYGYGPFPAPNGGFGGPAFSAVVVGEGGPEQGDQQLNVYSNYNDGQHGFGNLVEANVFEEQTIGAADVGSTWLFEFDAKRGNIEGGTTALAFFKTLDPNNFFALTNFIWIDMTNLPDTWDRYSLSIFIDPSLDGQILQFGYLNVATNYEGSGILYDNINFGLQPLAVSLDVKPGSCPNPINNRSRGLIPAAVLGTGDFDVNDIDVASLQLEGVAPINWSYGDVADTYGGDLCGCTTAGPDGFNDLSLKFNSRELIDAIGPSPNGDLTLTLTGALLDGTPITGQDCVIMVGRDGAPRGRDVRVMGPSQNRKGRNPSSSN